jgi:hypothetical protein
MRLHFISRLALLITASFGVVATQVWTGETLELMFVIGGAVAIAVAAADTIPASVPQRTLDGVIALLGAWTVVEALVFSGNEQKWWSFGSACALAGLSVIGLVIHEMTTERVVHELSVSNGHQPSEPAPGFAEARS